MRQAPRAVGVQRRADPASATTWPARRPARSRERRRLGPPLGELAAGTHHLEAGRQCREHVPRAAPTLVVVASFIMSPPERFIDQEGSCPCGAGRYELLGWSRPTCMGVLTSSPRWSAPNAKRDTCVIATAPRDFVRLVRVERGHQRAPRAMGSMDTLKDALASEKLRPLATRLEKIARDRGSPRNGRPRCRRRLDEVAVPASAMAPPGEAQPGGSRIRGILVWRARPCPLLRRVPCLAQASPGAPKLELRAPKRTCCATCSRRP